MSTGSRRSMCQGKTPRTWKTSFGTLRSGCSCRGPMPRSHDTLPGGPSRRRPAPLAAGSGVAGVAARLDDRFRLLTGGSRTLPRHQTMRATLDWSFELLSESERVVLRRLGVFVGAFTLDAASDVAAGVDIPASEVAESVANLVGKSLVSTDVGGAIVRYRLPETTPA